MSAPPVPPVQNPEALERSRPEAFIIALWHVRQPVPSTRPTLLSKYSPFTATSSEGSMILHWHRTIQPQRTRGVQRPIRIPQHLSRKQDDIRFARSNDLIGLLCFRNQSNRAGSYPGFLPDPGREWRLIR